MSAITILLFLSSLLTPSSLPKIEAASFVQSVGKVRGTVMDYSGAVILDTKIVVKGENIERYFVVNERGEYEIELPAGIYNITAEANLFRPFRRAAFRVHPNTTTMINIVPIPMATHVFNPPIYYDSFTIPSSSDPSLHLLIAYQEKRKGKSFIEYEKVTASYDALTVIAGNMRFNKKTLDIEAQMNVIVEDGRQRMRSKRAGIKFKDGMLAVTFIQ